MNRGVNRLAVLEDIISSFLEGLSFPLMMPIIARHLYPPPLVQLLGGSSHILAQCVTNVSEPTQPRNPRRTGTRTASREAVRVPIFGADLGF